MLRFWRRLLRTGFPCRNAGGNGRCTTCRVKILEYLQNVAPRNELESRMAMLRGWSLLCGWPASRKSEVPVRLERQIKTFSEISRLREEMVKSGKGEEKQLAILFFCDMRNFTPFVEGNMAYDVVHIRTAFSALGDTILMNNYHLSICRR